MKMVNGQDKRAKVMRLEVLTQVSMGGIAVGKPPTKYTLYSKYDAVQDLFKQGLLKKAPNALYILTDKGREAFDNILEYAFELIF